MTRYDPFSYGQVRLGAKPAPTTDSPDDLLFADAGPKKQEPPAEDSSWSLLAENVDSLLPSSNTNASAMEFGAEILGETLPTAPMPAQPAARPRAVAAAQPAATRAVRADTGAKGAPSGQPVRGEQPKEVRAKAPVASSAAGPAATPPPARPALHGRRSWPIACVLVPFTLCAGGGTAASWFAITQQNPVMAGIVGLLSLVGAAFAWLSLRP